MSRKDIETLIKAWKEGSMASPAGAIVLDDTDLERVAGGGALEGTDACDTFGCCGTYTGGCCTGSNFG
ncbi:MAG: hypothetical protein AAF772_01680 [Acidobacteriota bacterium]